MQLMTKKTGALVATLALSGTLGMGQASAAQGESSPVRTASSATSAQTAGIPTDRQLNNMLNAMEQLPDRLKNMSPSDPQFQKELDRVGFQRVNWAWCAFKAGQFALEMGVPVAKVVRAFKAAKAAFGSWKLVYKAIKSGHASDVIGPEAVEILDQLTGASGVVNACS